MKAEEATLSFKERRQRLAGEQVAAVQAGRLGAEGAGVAQPGVRGKRQSVVTELEDEVSHVAEVLVLEVAMTAHEVVVGDPGHWAGSKGGSG